MGSPLRVLHAVVNMNRGGAETLLMNLYRNVDRTKIQFDFLTCKEGIFDQEIRSLGGEVHRIPYITEVGHRGYLKALNDFFSTYTYKVVHSHMDKMSGIVLRSAKDHNVPIRIAHSHNTSSEGGFAAKAYKWYAGKHVLPNATHYLACSNKAAQWLFNNKVNDVKILKNGIETSEFTFSTEVRKQVRDELSMDENSFVIGHVGRFNHQKNHAFLINLFKEIVKTKPEARLVLVGDGHLRDEIEQKIKKLKLGNKVKILGVRNDISQLLQSFDLFVFPSLHEGLPVTLIEAQGAGVPCIISDVITPEVDMGLNLIHFVSLKNKDEWIKRLNSFVPNIETRVNSDQALALNGYDIRNTAAWTEGFYLAI